MSHPRSGLPLASRIILDHLHKVGKEFGREGQPFDYSMVECAESLSISQRTVSRSLQQLQEAELISFVPGKGQRTTRVQLLPEPLDDSEPEGGEQ